MTRKYELKKRAERQEETRQRIVEAAIRLHRTKGPARTTFSDIAALAGVQRHTLYRYFPDERAMGLACSGHHFELNPPPDPAVWEGIADPAERLRVGLEALYAWYERNDDMFSCVLRDAEVDPVTRELFELRSTEPMGRVAGVLSRGVDRSKRAQAAFALALDFHAWRRLAQSGLDPAEAAELMTAAVLGPDPSGVCP
jgi:AcrR family transcriptional regulator